MKKMLLKILLNYRISRKDKYFDGYEVEIYNWISFFQQSKIKLPSFKNEIILIILLQITYCISTSLYIAAAIWLEFLKKPDDQIWPIAILIGCSSSGILILSLASIVDVVGENQESSAFVYGAYSVMDKCFNGFGALVIQMISPCSDARTGQECTDGFASFFGRMMIIFSVLSCIIYLLLPKFTPCENDESFSKSHMNSVIISNRFQPSIHSSTLVYSLQNDETKPLLGSRIGPKQTKITMLFTT